MNSVDHHSRDQSLIRRIAAVPGLIRSGVCQFDRTIRLPLQPIFVESAYADPALLKRLAIAGTEAAERSDSTVIAGGESAGIPLATAIAMTAHMRHCFVRKANYVGHVHDEPMIRGSWVRGERVLLVDDAVWRGHALDTFRRHVEAEGGVVSGVFTVVDMRALARAEWADDRGHRWQKVPFFACTEYLELLHAAGEVGVLGRECLELVLSCIREGWSDSDPRWHLLSRNNAAQVA